MYINGSLTTFRKRKATTVDKCTCPYLLKDQVPVLDLLILLKTYFFGAYLSNTDIYSCPPDNWDIAYNNETKTRREGCMMKTLLWN